MAGGLLALSGLMHLVLVFTTPEIGFLIAAFTVIFGIADMALGVMIVKGMDKALPYGVAIPLIGGLFVLMTMSANVTPWNILFLVIYIFVIASSLFLMRAGGPVIGRVK